MRYYFSAVVFLVRQDTGKRWRPQPRRQPEMPSAAYSGARAPLLPCLSLPRCLPLMAIFPTTPTTQWTPPPTHPSRSGPQRVLTPDVAISSPAED